jgi:hypothetical protein
MVEFGWSWSRFVVELRFHQRDHATTLKVENIDFSWSRWWWWSRPQKKLHFAYGESASSSAASIARIC